LYETGKYSFSDCHPARIHAPLKRKKMDINKIIS
jgi:hypothetical protein